MVGSALHAQVVDINGGNSWSGWNAMGNSQTSGTWVRGSTSRTYDVYSTYFVLSASQTVGASRITDGSAGNGTSYVGDAASSLFSDSWQAGDRIVGMGIQYTGTTRGNTWFFHTDRNGDNISAASTFGALDGVSTHDAGDTAGYISNLYAGNVFRGQVSQYSIWTGYSPDGSPQNGNYIFPYGGLPSLAMPTRSFSVLDAGSANLSKSMQYFINIDAILRSNGGATYGDGDFGLSTRFGFWEGGSGAGNFSQQIFSVPAPGAIALLGLAGLAGTRRRR
jgi:hypothetical protein